MVNTFQLAPVFTDNMVLQRDSIIPVWGKAPGNCEVKLEFCGQTHLTNTVNGDWCIHLSPIKAGGPHKMKIESNTRQITLENILIGEVWLAGGQSNMQFCLQDSFNGDKEVSQANYNNIRYYDVPKIEYEHAGINSKESTKGNWQICTPERSGSFSAVAYHFAKNIMKSLGVPVGIIGCNWGGTSASCWMSEEYLAADDELRVYLDEFKAQVQNMSDEEYDRLHRAYYQKVAEYNEKVRQFKLSNPSATTDLIDRSVGPYPWPPPMGKRSFMRPSGLYYTMLKKIVPYGIRGVLYYQGEGDTHKPHLYKRLFSTLIQNWRDIWESQELPVLFVQLPFFNDPGALKDNWAYLREAQLTTMLSDKYTAMAVITDCSERDNIHPINKKPVGERLALLAQAGVYGNGNKRYNSPLYSNMKVDDGVVTLYFDNAENGLITKNGELKGFTIAGKDNVFVDAVASIKGNTVEVCAENIKHPTAVRYGWSNYSETNLFNKEGFPVIPFRTDAAM